MFTELETSPKYGFEKSKYHQERHIFVENGILSISLIYESDFSNLHVKCTKRRLGVQKSVQKDSQGPCDGVPREKNDKVSISIFGIGLFSARYIIPMEALKYNSTPSFFRRDCFQRSVPNNF
mmetsp:Transcript_8428/g.20832  ORF Transcript_8428/g.20832 Transcript_8428/m.20832 type:complete len:122 (+) Transcript_8428:3250-3615(+)